MRMPVLTDTEEHARNDAMLIFRIAQTVLLLLILWKVW
jgi:hypothetical protein